MVLTELGSSISAAMKQMMNATIVDDMVFNQCLNDINRALLMVNVNFELVNELSRNIKKTVNLDHLAAGHNKRKIIEKAVFDELCRMLDCGKPCFTPVKGKTSVVMFVGLQGSGKTTTCTKYAHYYQRKGFKPAVICADTFRAGAFDQLKQNATKANVPFYGDLRESDPIKVALEGLERFKNAGIYDLVIIDTSGRHKQEAALFEEMRQLSEVSKPDLVVFVMDGSIGQAAFAQATAFKQCVADVGAVIVTKMDGGNSKGGGALSAVAATKSPVIFIGTGEHIHEFEGFSVKPFVSRLLGLQDWRSFADKVREAVPKDDNKPEELMQQMMSRGNFTLRTLYKLYKYVLTNVTMGPLGDIFSFFPGLGMSKDNEMERNVTLRRHLTILDSMTAEELDAPNLKIFNESRVMRIARGSGRLVGEVSDVLAQYKTFAKSWPKMMKQYRVSKNGQIGGLPKNLNPKITKMIPQELLSQFGGMQNLMSKFNGRDK